MQNTIEMGPVLRPSQKEFENFEEYIQSIENKYSKNYGLVKIIPPRSFRARKLDYEESIAMDQIPKPIEQNAYGKGGIYECLHIVQKSIRMKDYRKKVEKFQHITEGKSQEQIEELFYKNIAFSPPLYGADARSTLFDEDCQWNLGKVKNLLTDGVSGIISGVNDPYLYVGSWKTMFAWHREDMDLAAINYLHYGKPKFWYAIPEEDKHYLDKMAKLYFADNFNKCPEYMRHKTTIINPYLLKKQFPQCRINKMIQKEREFIVVFGGCYHHGFNYGFNIAEAVNYATKNWLRLFLEAKPCKCINGVVKINHGEFYDNIVARRPELKDDPQIKYFLREIKARGLYEKDQQKPAEPKETKPKKQESSNSHNPISSKQLPIIKKKIQKKEKKILTLEEDEDEQEEEDTLQGVSGDSKEDSQNSQSSTTVNRRQKSSPQKKVTRKRAPKQSTPAALKQKKQQLQKQQNANKSTKTQEQVKKIESIILKNRKNKSQKQQEQPVLSKMILEDWLQCDSCKKWRKIDSTLKNLKRRKNFFCGDISINCRRVETDITYTLGQQLVQQQN